MKATSLEQSSGSTKDLNLELHTLPNPIELRGMRITNYSDLATEQIYSWLPRDLKAEEVVFFPDVCPSNAPLPTGTVILTRDPAWRKLAISDCGCGMQLLRSSLKFGEFKEGAWDSLGQALMKNKGALGDLGGGNHFVDALVSYTDERISFLIHTGSRRESGLVDQFTERPGVFEDEFSRVVGWARQNRDTVAEAIRKIFGKCELVLDLPHNTFEIQSDHAVIIRKGAVKVRPGEMTVLPSSMSGDVVLLEASKNVETSLFSMSHGTGRTMSRSGARDQAGSYDFSKLRKAVYIPSFIADASLRTEAPYCYRPLDNCLELIKGLAEAKERLAVIAYLGHL